MNGKINKTEMIPVEWIIPNKNQPRKHFDETSLNELAESIAKVGIIQPLTVKHAGNGRFDLIAGERRLRAAQLVGLRRVPCIIFEASEEDAAFLSMIENVQREDLNFVEEATGYKQLLSTYRLTQEQLSEIIGKKQSTIANKLRILNLNEDVLALLQKNNLTERHARALLKLPVNERMSAARRIVRRGLNVRQTEEMIDAINGKAAINPAKRRVTNIFDKRIYVNTIKKAFSDIKKTGVRALYAEQEDGENITITIVIPKK
ncbi:MAG: ParB/RepB/Spo0J family partition protein [Eubacteriales bacterium]|jgi:ParB family chromosome partitioning protein